MEHSNGGGSRLSRLVLLLLLRLSGILKFVVVENRGFVFRGMENRGPVGFSVLNCIDLSSPRIDDSVSLLKQVGLVSGLLCLVAQKKGK